MHESVEAACRASAGTATAAQLTSRGCSRAALTAAVRSGILVRPRRGTYAASDLPPAALTALSHGGPLCCASAAREHGLWVLEDAEAVHVWLGPDGRAHPHAECSCVVHRDGAQPVVGAVVGVAHCLQQMIGCLGPEAFFAALESALRQGRISPAQREQVRLGIPKRHRWLVDFARADADSGLESLVRLRLHRLGIDVACQVRIPGVGIVDFVIGDCLILEADGRTHGGENRHRDHVRDAVASVLGFVTLRYDYALIVHEWELVEAAVLAAVGRGLHRSAAGLRAEASVPLPL